MDSAAFFFSLALLVLVGIYLYAPLAQRNARPVTEEEHEVSALMAERERILNALQELDFDFKLGKIPGEDYPLQRSALLKKGADILRRLDEIAPERTQQNIETRIERAIAVRRAEHARVKATPITDPVFTSDKVEAMIAARRRSRGKKSVRLCPTCANSVMPSDRFCSSCGQALT